MMKISDELIGTRVMNESPRGVVVRWLLEINWAHSAGCSLRGMKLYSGVKFCRSIWSSISGAIRIYLAENFRTESLREKKNYRKS